MKQLIPLSSGLMMLALLGAGFVAAQDRAFNGEIMDSACAKMGSHEGMMKDHPGIKDAKACTLGCVKNGSTFVLYDPDSKKVYDLDDQTKPRQFAGEKVKVMGSVDSADKIHVRDIQKGS
jgi:hypothetical protein